MYIYVLAPAPNGDNGSDIKLFDLAKSVHWLVDDGVPNFLRKKRKVPGNDDSDDEDLTAPPRNDIYRLRQQKKIK